jgi:glucose/arabinose dehydrogenase
MNEKLGNNLVPDYITESVKGENGWYGWPYSYFEN